MTKDEQLELFRCFTDLQRATLTGKADDYTAGGDRLENFKVAGAVAGMDAQRNCLALIATKVARLGSLLKDGRQPRNEATEDSILDLANYAFLLYCIMAEKAAHEDRGK